MSLKKIASGFQMVSKVPISLQQSFVERKKTQGKYLFGFSFQ
jgi:hypothetical protein